LYINSRICFSKIGLNVQNSVKDRLKEPDDSGTEDRCKPLDFKFEPCTSEELVKILKSLKQTQILQELMDGVLVHSKLMLDIYFPVCFLLLIYH